MQPIRFRKLRIAWSVLSGLASLLLIALWVRSYWRGDVLQLRPIPFGPEDFGVGSAHGVIGADGNLNPLKYMLSPGWKLWSYPMFDAMTPPPFLFKYEPAVGFELNLPHWFLSLIFGMLGAVPWIRRFGLRTLLIATTLIAVVLGLVVWAIQ